MRALSLHGYASNGAAFTSHKAKALQEHVGSLLALDAIDGPAQLEGGRGKQRAWWQFAPAFPMSRVDQPGWWALEAVEYVDAEATIDGLVHTWQEGGYDALLGFSQGALCAAMLCA